MPYLDDYQIEFNGVTIGDGTEYDCSVIEGLESWDVRDSDVAFPNQWGSLPGEDEVNARRIHIEAEMLAGDPAIALAFETAFLPQDGSELLPLVAKFPGRDDITLDVRCRMRSRRRQVSETLGALKITVDLVAPDPRAYGYAETVESLPPFTVGTQSLNFTSRIINFTSRVLNFTGTPAVGEIVVVNSGNVDMYPEFVITPGSGGPLNQYRVTNVTLDEELELNAVLTPGQSLIADMAMIATPKQGLPIRLATGESRYGSWSHPRVPLRVAPGANTFRFEVISGTASGAACQITARPAWL